MGLTKEDAELLTSRQKEWHLLDPTCEVYKYKKRHSNLEHFLLFQSLILCAIAETYLDFLMNLE